MVVSFIIFSQGIAKFVNAYSFSEDSSILFGFVSGSVKAFLAYSVVL